MRAWKVSSKKVFSAKARLIHRRQSSEHLGCRKCLIHFRCFTKVSGVDSLRIRCMPNLCHWFRRIALPLRSSEAIRLKNASTLHHHESGTCDASHRIRNWLKINVHLACVRFRFAFPFSLFTRNTSKINFSEFERRWIPELSGVRLMKQEKSNWPTFRIVFFRLNKVLTFSLSFFLFSHTGKCLLLTS